MQPNLRTTQPILHYGILTLFYVIGLVTLGSHTALHALGGNHHAAESTSVCATAPAHKHTLNFTTSGVSPNTLVVNKCDEVTITNGTGEELIAAIGPHSHHTDYPGFTETPLRPGQTYSFRASQSGSFPIHDHDNESIAGTLIIK